MTVTAELLPMPELERNPAFHYLAGLRRGEGRRTMRNRLRSLARTYLGFPDELSVPWTEFLNFATVNLLKNALAQRGLRGSTIKHYLSAYRGVAEAAYDLELIPLDTLARIKRVRPAREERLPAGRHVPNPEIAALLRTCDETPRGLRDRALILILHQTGLRRAEAVCLRHEDVTQEPGRASLRVLGKGSVERSCFISGAAVEALRALLEIVDGGWVFQALDINGQSTGKHLCPSAIGKILDRRALCAGVPHLSAHDMRRTCATNMLNAGVGPHIVQKVLGHASIETTMRYDRSPEETKAVAASAVEWRGEGGDA